jgi:hypothetical protein
VARLSMAVCIIICRGQVSVSFFEKMIMLSLTFTIDKFFAKIGGSNCNPPIYETIKGHG